MLFSATTVRATLQGFAAIGLDAEALRREAGIDAEVLDRLDGVVEADRLFHLWRLALSRSGRDELPTEVGLAIPHGAFGALDYIAASARDIASGFESLAQQFPQVSSLFSLETGTDADGAGFARIVWSAPHAARDLSDEVTVAIIVGHFRDGARGAFRARAVRLTRPEPSRPTRHSELLGAAVTFGCACSAIEVDRDVWRRALPLSDPTLQDTLRRLSAHLSIADDDAEIASAVRRVLLRTLPSGEAAPEGVARALGLSERSVQRRLQQSGTSFKRVLDELREAESERLLAQGVALSDVAQRLGFSDQTTWTRAFKRWKGQAPLAWLAARRGPAGPRSRS